MSARVNVSALIHKFGDVFFDRIYRIIRISLMLLCSILSILLSCQKQGPMQFDALPYLRIGVLGWR